MDFALTAEQKAMGEMIESYIANRFDLAAVREAGGDCPASLWETMAEQGWLAVLVPERFGGLDLGMVEAQIIARAIGGGLLPGPWRGTVLAGEALRLAGSDALCEEWMQRIASGEARGAVAFAGSEIAEYPASADLLFTFAADEVRLANPHDVTEVEQYDITTRLGRVALDGAPLPGADGAEPLLARATVLIAAELAGLAEAALRRTVEYCADRVQFGRPIGSFQAIKHSLAELHVATVMASHAALYAAYALDSDAPDAPLAVSVAKAKCSDTAKRVTAAMIQYHGGIGFTWEHDAHLFYKRAKRLAATSGDAGHHNEQIARLTVDPLGRQAPDHPPTTTGDHSWEHSTIASL